MSSAANGGGGGGQYPQARGGFSWASYSGELPERDTEGNMMGGNGNGAAAADNGFGGNSNSNIPNTGIDIKSIEAAARATQTRHSTQTFRGLATVEESKQKRSEDVAFWQRDFAPWAQQLMQVLKQVFGLNTFRVRQKEIINATLCGRDTFVLLPTGGGKSLCYQLPAIVNPGDAPQVTIVFSPLLSLIHDQVQQCHANKINALALVADTKEFDRRALMSEWDGGEIQHQMVFITPEYYGKSDILINRLQSLANRGLLARFIIDEAHCISSWGHDFRPDYKKLAMLRSLFPAVPIMALTATATQRVLDDCMRTLQMIPARPGRLPPLLFKGSFNRRNLQYYLHKVKQKDVTTKVLELLKRPHLDRKCGIVYCLSKRDCETMAQSLSLAGIPAAFYHSETSNKASVFNDWMVGRTRVMCATIAFGMGINKADVRIVIHASLPKSVEGLYQESGRAGRDGNPAECHLCYAPTDIGRNLRLIYGSRDHSAQVKNIYQVQRYCTNDSVCRRKQQLDFFSEDFTSCDENVAHEGMVGHHATGAGNMKENLRCDNCYVRYGKTERGGTEAWTPEAVDYTARARHILDLVIHFGSLSWRQLCNVYRGLKTTDKRIANVTRTRGGCDAQGKGKDLNDDTVDRIICEMLHLGILADRLEQVQQSVVAYSGPGPAQVVQPFKEGRIPVRLWQRKAVVARAPPPAQQKQKQPAAAGAAAGGGNAKKAATKRAPRGKQAIAEKWMNNNSDDDDDDISEKSSDTSDTSSDSEDDIPIFDRYKHNANLNGSNNSSAKKKKKNAESKKKKDNDDGGGDADESEQQQQQEAQQNYRKLEGAPSIYDEKLTPHFADPTQNILTPQHCDRAEMQEHRRRLLADLESVRLRFTEAKRAAGDESLSKEHNVAPQAMLEEMSSWICEGKLGSLQDLYNVNHSSNTRFCGVGVDLLQAYRAYRAKVFGDVPPQLKQKELDWIKTYSLTGNAPLEIAKLNFKNKKAMPAAAATGGKKAVPPPAAAAAAVPPPPPPAAAAAAAASATTAVSFAGVNKSVLTHDDDERYWYSRAVPAGSKNNSNSGKPQVNLVDDDDDDEDEVHEQISLLTQESDGQRQKQQHQGKNPFPEMMKNDGFPAAAAADKKKNSAAVPKKSWGKAVAEAAADGEIPVVSSSSTTTTPSAPAKKPTRTLFKDTLKAKQQQGEGGSGSILAPSSTHTSSGSLHNISSGNGSPLRHAQQQQNKDKHAGDDDDDDIDVLCSLGMGPTLHEQAIAHASQKASTNSTTSNSNSRNQQHQQRHSTVSATGSSASNAVIVRSTDGSSSGTTTGAGTTANSSANPSARETMFSAVSMTSTEKNGIVAARSRFAAHQQQQQTPMDEALNAGKNILMEGTDDDDEQHLGDDDEGDGDSDFAEEDRPSRRLRRL